MTTIKLKDLENLSVKDLLELPLETLCEIHYALLKLHPRYDVEYERYNNVAKTKSYDVVIWCMLRTYKLRKAQWLIN